MHPEILEGPQRSTLALLARAPILPGVYLAGGTALALHLGHRRSVDLDFFSLESVESENLVTLLRQIGEIRIERSELGDFRGHLGGVPISFIRYSYPLLEPLIHSDLAPPVAGIRDIASMKLSAIMSRGARRDFVDVYAVCQHGFSLEEIYACFQRKYHGVSYDPYHLARSLVYFLDAEKEAMPLMLWPCGWDEIKAFFVRESQRVFAG